MTHIAGGGRRGIAKAWILPLLAVVLILLAIYLDLLSRSIAVDFIAWWPVWLLLVVLGIMGRRRRIGRVRVSGLIAILLALCLGLFVTGNARGWAAMPSASTRLVGPGSDAASNVALSAQVEGEIRVGPGLSGFLYTVEPLRRGGEVGPPAAVEQVQGTNLSVHLEPEPEPGLYTFAGWVVDLDPAPIWNLSLGGVVDADLETLRIAGLQLSGEGRVSLGSVTESTVVNVSGTYVITVAPGTPVRVVGDALVPGGWIASSEGWSSPTPGDGWVISVGEGTSLSVNEG
ncbi:MAG TPA: hypothetical protein VIH55_05035 [Acidimicrobiia bacterium]